jgi:type II secretion system protein N
MGYLARMWMRLAAIGVLVACGSKSSPDADAIEYEADVDLATQPTSEWAGLPMSGIVHVEAHLQHAKADLSKADGTLRLTCANGCQLGDDKARLYPTYKPRSIGIAAQGVDFGHIAFDSFEIVIGFDHGTATITKWNVVSPDVQLVTSGSVKLGRGLGDSIADLCVRFSATPALKQHSDLTFTAIELAGEARSEKDGLFNVQILDRLDHPRRLARVCDGSAQPVARPSLAMTGTVAPSPAVSTLPTTPPPAIPVTKVDPATAALVASTIKQTSETTFDIDAKKWEQLWANPAAIAKGTRVVPTIEHHGQTVGFKIYQITPDSPTAHFGLVNGDVITTISGVPLTSIDKALESFAKVRAAKVGDSVKMTIVRQGMPTMLTYTMR